jgi:hypothetical protein
VACRPRSQAEVGDGAQEPHFDQKPRIGSLAVKDSQFGWANGEQLDREIDAAAVGRLDGAADARWRAGSPGRTPWPRCPRGRF